MTSEFTFTSMNDRIQRELIDACKALGPRYKPTRVYLGLKELLEVYETMKVYCRPKTSAPQNFDEFMALARTGDIFMNTFNGAMVVIPVDMETHASIGGDRA